MQTDTITPTPKPAQGPLPEHKQTFSTAAKLLTTSAAQPLRRGYYWLRNALGWYDDESTIIKDNQNWWNDEEKLQGGQYIHKRGVGIFKDDAKWMDLGQESFDIYKKFLHGMDYDESSLKSMVDWGCGGGANAVHWAPTVERFYALDISQVCVDECILQMEREGIHNGVPVLVDAGAPEEARKTITDPLDLFFCVYVVEVLPTKEYVERLLKLAHDMLRPGGLAFIQLKYADERWATQGRRWSYANNPCHMTTFRIEEFWVMADGVGLKPQLCTLLPKQPKVNDERYAYFMLQRLE